MIKTLKFICLLTTMVVLLTSCINSNNKENPSVNLWIENTLNLMNASYADTGNIGGFVSNSFSKDTTDIVNTTWNLETLTYLNGESIKVDNKVERNTEILDLLSINKKEDNMSLAYIYWAILNIYNKSEIDIPHELIEEVKIYINSNSDSHGFAISDDKGLTIIDKTVLYSKIYDIINEHLSIDGVYLNEKLSQAISKNDSLTVIQLNNISYFSGNHNQETIKLTNDYMKNYIKGINYENTKKNISEVSLFLPYFEREGIDPEISGEQKIKYAKSFKSYIINRQGINGKLLYDYVHFLSNEDRQIAKQYITDNMNKQGLWSATRLRIPNVSDTNLSLKMYTLLNKNLEVGKLGKVINLYEMKLEKSPNINDYPELIGIKMFFDKNKIDMKDINVSDFIKLFNQESIEVQAKIYAKIILEYHFNNIEYDNMISDMEKTILKKSVNLDESITKYDMNTVFGLLISTYNQGKISKEKLETYLDHFKKDDGYSINPNIQYGDVIGTYLAINIYEMANMKIPKDLQESISLYRRDLGGYSFFIKDPETYNLYSTFVGFDAEKTANNHD